MGGGGGLAKACLRPLKTLGELGIHCYSGASQGRALPDVTLDQLSVWRSSSGKAEGWGMKER